MAELSVPGIGDAIGPGLLALRRPDLELVEQRRGGDGHRVDRVAERLGVMPGRRAEAADLPHVLQRGGADIVIGNPLGVVACRSGAAATIVSTAAKNSASCSSASPRISTAPGKSSSCVGSTASWEKRFIARQHSIRKANKWRNYVAFPPAQYKFEQT